jgi:hypothetical protein
MMIAYDCPMIDLRRKRGNLFGGEGGAPASARYTTLFRQRHQALADRATMDTPDRLRTIVYLCIMSGA